ncbi:MAG: NAD(P)H-dependent oxidoreductase [Planctomycetes bacterium]|nr:NAD(P)H-dependent oxidoreductase [Planctomycetota bacterium]
MNAPLAPDSLLAQLRWRCAVKKFDPSRTIAPATWRALEEALVLTPSSYGLQPWKFVVVESKAVREQLLPASWNQRQIVDASHLVVLCIQKHFGADGIDRFVKRMATVRGVAPESLDKFRSMMVRDVAEGARSWRINDWSANQLFIALGNLMTSAALLGIDTCPIEGFEPPKYDQILGLAAQGLAATVVCAAGYRAADDKYAAGPKVRFPLDEVIERR